MGMRLGRKRLRGWGRRKVGGLRVIFCRIRFFGVFIVAVLRVFGLARWRVLLGFGSFGSRLLVC